MHCSLRMFGGILGDHALCMTMWGGGPSLVTCDEAHQHGTFAHICRPPTGTCWEVTALHMAARLPSPACAPLLLRQHIVSRLMIPC